MRDHMLLDHLKKPGVVSVGVNNAAAYARTTAATFGDPQWKFHDSLFLDPKVMVFAPTAKLIRRPRRKMPDGTFRFLDIHIGDCPSVYGLPRTGKFDSKTFFTDAYAHWGKGGKQPEREFTRLASMLLGVRLLYYLGCPRVYMLGVDFWSTNEKAYAWNEGRSGGNGNWWKIDRMLDGIREEGEKRGFTMYNLNPDSDCKVFETRTCLEAVGDTLQEMPQSCPPDLNEYYSHRRMDEDRAKHPEPLPVMTLKPDPK